MNAPVIADFFAHYSYEYEIIGYIMLFFILAAHLFWGWSPERSERQQGYCILIFGVVAAYAELWLLSALGLHPDNLFGMRETLRSFWGTPQLVSSLSYAANFLTWAFVSYHGGRLMHQLLVRVGSLSDEAES